MHIFKTFKYRIHPTPKQIQRMTEWNNALRFLWNLAHEQRLMALARPIGERKYYTGFDQANQLTEMRAEIPWLKDVPRGVSGQVLMELDLAWQRCFKKLTQTPRFKSKTNNPMPFSFQEPNVKSWNLRGTLLRFPKLGNIRLIKHRELQGTPKLLTIKQDVNRWYALIVCEIEVPDPTPRTTPIVGLDRGIKAVVADSVGNLVSNPGHFKKSQAQLAKAQKNYNRKKKGSKNQEKAKKKVANLHQRIRLQREHFLHNISSQYSKSHGVVVVEKLEIGNMVKVNSGLAKSILDVGWGMLISQLKYKQEWSGGSVIEVPAHYTSQTCSQCGSVDAGNRKSQAEFCCLSCGHSENADVNAAKNIERRGSPSVLLGDGSPPEGPKRTKKSLRTAKVPRNNSF